MRSSVLTDERIKQKTPIVFLVLIRISVFCFSFAKQNKSNSKTAIDTENDTNKESRMLPDVSMGLNIKKPDNRYARNEKQH